MNAIFAKAPFIFLYCLIALVMNVARPSGREARGDEAVVETSKKSAAARQLIEQLGNADVKSKSGPEGSDPYLIIPTTFNWEREKHVCENIDKLIEMGTDAFPELIAHLDDNRFCGFWLGAVERPVHVGKICREIIERQVEVFHYDIHAPIIIKWVPNTLPQSDWEPERKPVWERWWKKNQDKSLRKLQIEAAEASIALLNRSKERDRGFDSWRAKQIKGLQRMIEDLKKSKKPKPARAVRPAHDLRIPQQSSVKRVGDEDRYYYCDPS
jgi:hypothetical protein